MAIIKPINVLEDHASILEYIAILKKISVYRLTPYYLSERELFYKRECVIYIYIYVQNW